MGADLAAGYPEARALFERADAVLGEPLSRLLFEGPERELTLTRNAQPALLVTSLAALVALESAGPIERAFVAGHSLGEWTALVAAGVLAFDDAVRLVRLRGDAMQEAVPSGEGGMAALMGLDAAAVDAVCAAAAEGQVVSAANHNGAGQIVIAGHTAAVARACDLARARGARRAVVLPVSAPFHCALMAPAAARVAVALADVPMQDPRVPVVTNVDAAPTTTAARARELLVAQITSPVRWEDGVKRLAAEGVTHAVELGSGAVLAGLVKRIAPGIRTSTISTPTDVQAFTREPV
jgi:[acyl-carrier-protein] S-malonyltransferase